MNTSLNVLPHGYGEEAIPKKTDIDAFTRTLFNHPVNTPEEGLLANVQSQSEKITQTIDGVKKNLDVIDNPETMLQTQFSLGHLIVEVDLTAKIAGTLANGINKLVHIQ